MERLEVSGLTPLAVAGVALVGAFLIALAEQLVAGLRPAPLVLVRRSAAVARQPLTSPEVKDGFLYHLAPSLLLAAALVALAMVPWAPGFRGIDIEVGALLFPAVLAYVSPALYMAGWGAGRPLAVVGAFRFVAVLIAWEMPLVMAITAVATPAGSLRPVDIVQVQDVPLALSQPLALALFVPAVLATAFLPPFDLAQSRAELGGGTFSQYTGLHRALVSLSQRVLLLAAAGMTAALFLGGWLGPWLPPAVWMVLKTAAVALLLLWAGRRLPRVELPDLLSVVWKYAVPAAILAIVWAGLVTRLFYA